MLNLRLKEVEPWTRGVLQGAEAVLEAPVLNLRLKEVEPWTRGVLQGGEAVLEARPC